MTKTEAADVLNLPPNAGIVEVRRTYAALYSEYRIRLDNAPTASLKKAYQKNLEDLRTASELLCPGVLEEVADLPAALPVRAMELTPNLGDAARAQAGQQPPGLSRGLLFAGGIAIAFATLASFLALRQFSSPGPPVVLPVGPATLLVMTDLACDWSLDGFQQARIAPGRPAKVGTTLGKHLINATTADGLDSVEVIFETNRPQQEIVRLKMNAARTDRLETEAEAEAVAATLRSKAERQRKEAGRVSAEVAAEAERHRAATATGAEPKGGSVGSGNGDGVGPDRGGGIGDGVYRTGNGVTPPELLHKVEPEYSEEARKAKVHGTVVLHIVVDPNGNAVNPRVVKSLGSGLDEKAIEAVRQWKFKPGYKDGKAVPVAVTVEVNFRLV